MRVVAGTGRDGAIRVLVLVVAMALAVTASLVIAFVPMIGVHRAQVAAARTVRQATTPADTRFRAVAVDAAVGEHPLRRVLIAAPPSAPAPPGAGAAPRAGEVLVSPSLRGLMDDEPFVRAFSPGNVVGTVAPAGLTTPDELFAYVGVESSPELVPAAGFGSTAALAGGGSSSFVLLQLALFVLIPAIGFVLVASTLSSRARALRWDAMRSSSVPESTIRHVAAVETGLTSLIGGALGLVLFTVVRVPLTDRGVGGLQWFSDDLRLNGITAAVVLVGVTGIGALLGRRAARLRSVDSMHERSRHVHPVVRGLPLMGGVAVLASLVALHHVGTPVNNPLALMIGALLAAAGLGWILVPFIRSAGLLVAQRSTSLGWRLGGHRAAYEPRSIVRILAGLVALTIVGYVTFAVLADLRLAVGGDSRQTLVSVSTRDASPGRVEELRGLRPPAVAFGSTITEGPDRASIAVADCATFEHLADLEVPCRDGSAYRVARNGFPSDLEAGRAYRFSTLDDHTLDIAGPVESATDRLGVFDARTILVADPVMVSTMVVGEVRFVVDRSDLLALEAAIARLDPQATVSTALDVDKVESYDQQLAVARVGAAIGGLLATLCFAVASVDRLLERRSHTATLVAMGVPRRTLRLSQVAQLLLPMGAALVLANLVGWLIAQSYLAVGGIALGVPFGLLAKGSGVSLVALVVACAVGAVVSVPTDIVAQLRRE
jgi:hypothetical protein